MVVIEVSQAGTSLKQNFNCVAARIGASRLIRRQCRSSCTNVNCSTTYRRCLRSRKWERSKFRNFNRVDASTGSPKENTSGRKHNREGSVGLSLNPEASIFRILTCSRSNQFCRCTLRSGSKIELGCFSNCLSAGVI